MRGSASIIPLVLAAIAMSVIGPGVVVALVLPTPAAQPCRTLDLTLNSYDGPIRIDGACVDTVQITNIKLRVLAYDVGDGIFRNGFEDRP